MSNREGLEEQERCPDPVGADSREGQAAIRTLTAAGYTFHGGTLWKPPLGKFHAPEAETLYRYSTLCLEAESVGLKLFANRDGFILRHQHSHEEYHQNITLSGVEAAIDLRKAGLRRG